jgi:hypothetical protein
MVKSKFIKLELSPNTSKSFTINTKIYGNHIECVGKAAGKINDDYFSTKYTFNIDAKSLKIMNINFVDLKQVGECNTSEIAKSTIDNCSATCDSLKNIFENKINKILYYIFSSANIIKNDITINVTLTNNANNSYIDYLVIHLKIGSNSYDTSSCLTHSSYSKTSKRTNISKTSCKSLSQKYENISSKHNSSSKSDNSSFSQLFSSTNSKSKNSDESFFSSETSNFDLSSKSNSKKNKKNYLKDILKIIAWGAIIAFVLYIFKIKIRPPTNYSIPENAKLIYTPKYVPLHP